MQNEPMISVIMATFNEPKLFIEESISSILNQTYRNLELLIADDSTNEETIKVIDGFASKDDRVIVIRKKERMGFVNALNEALHRSKGDYIARMDGDDISLPNRFELQLRFAESHPGIDVFGGSMHIINEKGEITAHKKYPTEAKRLNRYFMFRNPLAHPTIMFRRKVVEDGYYYNPEFKKAEDLELYLRLTNNNFKIGNLDEFLLKYRVLGGFSGKRAKDNWKYNHMARKKNFSLKRPLFSVCSYSISLLYKHLPSAFVNYMYKRENSEKSKR
jgi:glycosyltransferase involved in cell wall biosynthesis